MEVAVLEWYPSRLKEAKRLGTKYFFTGKPCKNGHYEPRETVSGKCWLCEKRRKKKYEQQNKEHVNALNRQSYERNKDKQLETKNRYYWDNKEWHNAWCRQHYEENKDYYRIRNQIYWLENKEEIKRRNYEWEAHNKEKRVLLSASRRAAKKKAIPPWFEEEAVNTLYSNSPEGYHVDHVVPLQSSYVCGLHCYDNLKIIPASENLSKHNYYWPGMPDYLDPQVAYTPETEDG